MPVKDGTVLARSEKTIFKYKDNISYPKEIEEWNHLVRLFLDFIIDRYTLERVKTWYFEVWNEPDISNFFDGTMEEYFELYKQTAQTIKAVNSEFKVGGPSTAKTRWVAEFYEYCKENDVPVDFISTHQYPGDALGHSFNREKHMEKMKKVLEQPSDSLLEVARSMFLDYNKIHSYPSNLLVNNAKVAKEKAKELPLYYTEWNTTSICVAPHNDSHMSAAYIVKTCIEADEILDGSSFWTFSDIFEELAYFTDPFYGGFGLLTIDGIEKPNYYAFKFLKELKDKKHVIVNDHDHLHISMYKDNNTIQLLLTNHHFNLEHHEDYEYSFILDGISNVNKISEVEISDQSCNATEIWKALGSKKPLKNNEIVEIREKAKPISKEIEYRIEEQGIVIEGKIHTNHTKLITIELGE